MKDIKIKLVVEGDSKEAIKGLDTLTDKEKQVAENFKKIQKEADKAGKEIKETATKSEKAFSGINNQLNNIGTAIAGAFAVEAIIQFGQEAVHAFAEAELGAKRLEFAVKNLAGSNGFEKLNAQAEALMETSIFDDDAIKAAQTELIKYGLSVDEVSKLMPRLVDAASVSGKSLDELVSISVSAFEGRVIGVQKELGIQLDKNATKTQMVGQLFEGLGKYAGGASDALGTTAGKMQSLSNAFGEFTESVGEAIVSIPGKIAEIGNSISDFLLKNLNAEAYARQEQLKADKAANEARLQENREFNQRRQRQFERDYEDGLVEFKKFTKKQLQAELASMEEADKMTRGVSGYKGYIQAIKELIEQKSKEEKAHKDTIKKAHEPQIGAYAKLTNALSELNTKMLDYITMHGAGDIAIQGQINRLALQKKKVDELAEAYKNFGKQIESTYQAETMDDPGSKAVERGIKESDKRIEDRKKKEAELLEARKMAEMEFFNLAFQLNDMLTQQHIENVRRSADAEIRAAEQVRNEKLAQEGITQKKREEYERAFQAQKLAIQKAAFEREKQLQIRQTLMAGALAVIKTFASYGGFTPPALIAAAAQAAQTAIQIGVIQAQKFEKGGWIDGKRHSDGGTLIEAERDEFVVNRKDAMKQSELLEAINKGQAESYIMKKFVLPAVVSKSMAQVQSETLADRIADSLKYQMFDDHRLRKTIQESTKQSAYYIVDGLKRSQKPTRYN